jgi:ABC-2 type transport system ATP-binding protein
VLFSSHVLSEVQALCERVIVLARGRVVGEGSTAALAGTLGARQRVVVRLEATDAAAHAMLARIAGVQRVERCDDGFVVEAAGDGDLGRRVGEAALGSGWVVLELRREALELEDVFLELVRADATA